tara:strand:+ start:944 stop:3013 length:2070 start_codon:yes stop_codon:yes gene_type:complete
MAYVLIEDFRGGLDARRSDVTATPGTLITLKNAHITRGGEIEKRPAFVSLATLPSNTTGLAAANGQIYVFGSAAASSVTFASGTPANVNYVRLQHPSGTALTKVLDTDFFDGQVYASAQFADGRIYHYYNGVRITDWFDGRSRNQFSVTGGSSGGTAATGSFTVASGTANPGDNIRIVRVNNIDLFSSSVAHTGTDSSTATNVANAINAATTSPNYTASASGAVVTITAVTTGITVNGFAVTVEVDGAVSVSTINNMSGGVDNAVTNITVNGVSIINAQITWATSNSNMATLISDAINDAGTTPEYESTSTGVLVNITSKDSGSSSNNYAVVITVTGNVTTSFTGSSAIMDGGATSNNVNGYTPGSFIKPVKTKMYGLSDSLLHFSGVNDPNEWNNTAVGAGFINLSNNAGGSEALQAVASYYSNLAVFAKEAIQIWFVSADEAQNSQIQVLNNTGTISPQSVIEFGDNDVFYLSESGIRSLRARDSSNAAFVGDIGNPIDDIILTEISSDRDAALNSQAILDPKNGRYLIAIGSVVYVFSYFPSSKVSAWSTYEPGFVIDNWSYDGTQVLCRSGNALYSLGGSTGQTYDSSTVEIQLPFLDAAKPATSKDFTGIDLSCTNQWTVYVSTDPTDITINQEIATIDRTTYGLGRATFSGYSTHLAPKLVCTSAGAAKIGNLALHYDMSEAG